MGTRNRSVGFEVRQTTSVFPLGLTWELYLRLHACITNGETEIKKWPRTSWEIAPSVWMSFLRDGLYGKWKEWERGLRTDKGTRRPSDGWERKLWPKYLHDRPENVFTDGWSAPWNLKREGQIQELAAVLPPSKWRDQLTLQQPRRWPPQAAVTASRSSSQTFFLCPCPLSSLPMTTWVLPRLSYGNWGLLGRQNSRCKWINWNFINQDTKICLFITYLFKGINSSVGNAVRILAIKI